MEFGNIDEKNYSPQQLKAFWSDIVRETRRRNPKQKASDFKGIEPISFQNDTLYIRFANRGQQTGFFSDHPDLLDVVRLKMGEEVNIAGIIAKDGWSDIPEVKEVKLPKLIKGQVETNLITFMEGAFTSIQNKIMHRIIVANERDMLYNQVTEYRQLSLFATNDFAKMRKITINLHEISRTNNYEHIKEAIEALRVMKVRIPVQNEDYSGEYVTSIVHSYFVPDGTSKRKEIILNVDNDVIDIMVHPFIEGDGVYTRSYAKGFNLLGNYDVVLNHTDNRFTQRIYKWLTSFRAKGDFTLPITEIRRMLGLGNKYSRWSDFKRAILTDTYNDMYKHRGEWELRFEYEEEMNDSVSGQKIKKPKGGFPDRIHFIIIKNEEEMRQEKEAVVLSEEERQLKEALDLLEAQLLTGSVCITPEQWRQLRPRIINQAFYTAVKMCYNNVLNYIQVRSIKNASGYLYSSLRKEIETIEKKIAEASAPK